MSNPIPWWIPDYLDQSIRQKMADVLADGVKEGPFVKVPLMTLSRYCELCGNAFLEEDLTVDAEGRWVCNGHAVMATVGKSIPFPYDPQQDMIPTALLDTFGPLRFRTIDISSHDGSL